MAADRRERTDGPGTLGALFEDLEQRWVGLELEERSAAVADLAVAAYGAVSVAGRAHASIGRPVTAVCLGGHRVCGVLRRAGADFVVIDDWVVAIGAISTVDGLADRSVPEEARPLTSALTLASILRGLDEARFVLVDGATVAGHIGRVGADFVEIGRDGARSVLRLAGVAAVRSER